MNSKHSIVALVIFCLSILTAGVMSAQAPAPRALPNDLLINAGFEGGAQYWTVTNASGDKVKCNGVGLVTSACAFMFKGGAGEATTIKQTYKAGVNSSQTQYVYFNANVHPVKASSITFFVIVKFKGGLPAIKLKHVYTALAGSPDYAAVEFVTSSFNAANVKTVVIGATNNSPSGKAYIDDFFVGAYSQID
jgi:hypothetical protein